MKGLVGLFTSSRVAPEPSSTGKNKTAASTKKSNRTPGRKIVPYSGSQGGSRTRRSRARLMRKYRMRGSRKH